ncbi:Xaa-Pro aminopeptidase [Chromatiales bacterium (ex Bugula neritina AB1)]|nr:Xaa-Pro aminopeptidase [Chromatiales bacterium (ex Bugula neritina AB1)]
MPDSRTIRRERSRRRKNLMRTIGKDSIAIIPAAPVKMRSRDTDYRYRQDSDFYYLTGFEEPESVAVLISGRRAAEYIIFCRERDEMMETWNGRRLGVDQAPVELDADDAFPIDDIDDILPGLMEGRDRVFYSMGRETLFDNRIIGWINQLKAKSGSGASVPGEFVSLDFHLQEMRLYKSRSELTALRKAAKISAAGHVAAMKACKPGRMEYELEAELISTYRASGAEHSFLPIVGGGVNGCILHYTENNAELRDGDLVLVDSGAEYNCYAGDITRTYPVNGEFTPAQREIYSIVLEANLAAIDKVVVGNHWNDPHVAAVRVITRGLVDLGILKGDVKTLIKDQAYRQFFMHRTGHWLGLDTHDVGEYKVDGKWRLLEAGMVLTIEPGIYLPDKSSVPKRYRTIGIRVEDDVIVTDNGPEVITSGVVKHIADIEALMQSD